MAGTQNKSINMICGLKTTGVARQKPNSQKYQSGLSIKIKKMHTVYYLQKEGCSLNPLIVQSTQIAVLYAKD
jgi:hypothetical protein